MTDLDPTKNVRESLYSLEQLFVKDPPFSRNVIVPEGFDFINYRTLTKNLIRDLRKSKYIIDEPLPRHGLAYLYLRLITFRFDRLKKWADEREQGWSLALTPIHEDLKWLVTKGLCLGDAIGEWTLAETLGVADLLGSHAKPLDRLKEKAREWSSWYTTASQDQQNAWIDKHTNGKDDKSTKWIQNCRNNERYCHQLVLESIDNCEVSEKNMKSFHFAELALVSLATHVSVAIYMGNDEFVPYHISTGNLKSEDTMRRKMAHEFGFNLFIFQNGYPLFCHFLDGGYGPDEIALLPGLLRGLPIRCPSPETLGDILNNWHDPRKDQSTSPDGDKHEDDLKKLESLVPELDKNDKSTWAKATELKAHKESARPESLQQQRSRGVKTANGLFGIDEVKRIWRKDRHVWYYIPSLQSQRAQDDPLIILAKTLISTRD